MITFSKKNFHQKKNNFKKKIHQKKNNFQKKIFTKKNFHQKKFSPKKFQVIGLKKYIVLKNFIRGCSIRLTL